MGSRQFCSMCSFCWDITAHSEILDMKQRLLTGLQFLRVVASPGFLIKGFTKASFHSVGKTPICRDRFTIFVVMGSRMEICSFR